MHLELRTKTVLPTIFVEIAGGTHEGALSMQAGKSKATSRILARQLLAWRASSIQPFVDKQRWALYQMLAGDIDAVTPVLGGGWMRSLATRLGCASPSSAACILLAPIS